MRKNLLTVKEVIHVANLAKLILTKKEVTKFQKQLSEVLDYFKILNKLNTNKVEPTSQVTGLENIEREDKVSESLVPQEVLSGGKKVINKMFKTDMVIEK